MTTRSLERHGRIRTSSTRRRACWLALALGASAASPDLARAQDNAAPRLLEGQHFTVDPVVDGVLVTGGIVFSELLGMVLNTGEIKPSPPGSRDNLLAIDRVAVTRNIDPHASRKSDYGLWVAY